MVAYQKIIGIMICIMVSISAVPFEVLKVVILTCIRTVGTEIGSIAPMIGNTTTITAMSVGKGVLYDNV